MVLGHQIVEYSLQCHWVSSEFLVYNQGCYFALIATYHAESPSTGACQPLSMREHLPEDQYSSNPLRML